MLCNGDTFVQRSMKGASLETNNVQDLSSGQGQNMVVMVSPINWEKETHFSGAYSISVFQQDIQVLARAEMTQGCLHERRSLP